jgi:Kef-type K+ transport system membrane component KefB
MSPTVIALFSFALIAAGTVAGLLLGVRLPGHHLDSDTKDAVRVAMAMVATMTALVLSLVTASAKNTFDADDTAVKQTAASLLSLDRYLGAYGSETKPIRDAMRALVTRQVAQIWSDSAAETTTRVGATAGGERLLDAILALKPANDPQRWYQGRALALADEVLQTRWLVFNEDPRSSPRLFRIVIVCWLTVLFASFGLFAPRNTIAIGALLICALSVAAAIFLILEMDNPFGGVMRVSDTPFRYALSQMGS